MKKHLKSLCVLVFCCFSFVSQALPDTCKVGVFLLDIYDFDLQNRAFTTDFWVWTNHRNDSLNVINGLEYPNTKKYFTFLTSSQLRPEQDSTHYASQKVTAIVQKEWDVRYFPFDIQEFKIEVESGLWTNDDLVFVSDSAACGYWKGLKFEEWEVVDFSAKSENIVYNSTYGDPALSGDTAYPKFTFSIWLQRYGRGTFFKLFLGLYISFSIAMLIFLLPYDSGDRIGILVGALFAAIGNKYIVDSVMPTTNSYTMVDKIYHFAFFELFFFFISTIFIVGAARSQKLKLAKTLNRLVFAVGLFAFVWVNVYFISEAVAIANEHYR